MIVLIQNSFAWFVTLFIPGRAAELVAFPLFDTLEVLS